MHAGHELLPHRLLPGHLRNVAEPRACGLPPELHGKRALRHRLLRTVGRQRKRLLCQRRILQLPRRRHELRPRQAEMLRRNDVRGQLERADLPAHLHHRGRLPGNGVPSAFRRQRERLRCAVRFARRNLWTGRRAYLLLGHDVRRLPRRRVHLSPHAVTRAAALQETVRSAATAFAANGLAPKLGVSAPSHALDLGSVERLSDLARAALLRPPPYGARATRRARQPALATRPEGTPRPAA